MRVLKQNWMFNLILGEQLIYMLRKERTGQCSNIENYKIDIYVDINVII